jgi:GNAT superfamily N-acetyltransferase
MHRTPLKEYTVRRADPNEYETLGRLTVQIYERLPGMPSAADQPDYYSMLHDVEARAGTPTIDIFVAATPRNELLGGVTFIGDMKFYGSGDTASTNADGSGIRLLAVKPEARGFGVGRALTNACIQRAAARGSAQVILHTTKSMSTAWGMYLRMGFLRSPDLDFSQGALSVFGFRLRINPPGIAGKDEIVSSGPHP